jgi:hypothetical protein
MTTTTVAKPSPDPGVVPSGEPVAQPPHPGPDCPARTGNDADVQPASDPF